MTTIYKYEFEIADTQEIPMPGRPKPLAVQLQDDQPCIWLEVDPTHCFNPRTLRVFGTGMAIATDGLIYVGTLQMGPYVWHVYID